ncbi:MAG: DUF342 domain-containing protein [Clostridiales bacterium]|nr:DUF342 domain-containing protein [Clostridiales bacterium]
MRARFFSGEDRQAAAAAAAAFFQMEVGQLVIEEVRPVEGAPPVQLLAIDPEGAPIDQMNGGFALRFEADGVYLELLPPRGQGLPIDRGGLQERLSRKGVSGLDRPLLEALLARGVGCARIAPPQRERLLQEEAVVRLSADAMEATLELLPPEPGGALMGAAQIKQALREAGVVAGLQEEEIARAAREHTYGRSYRVAVGRPPQDGRDGELIYHFDQSGIGVPTVDKEGKAYFRELNLFVPVERGQLLVTRVPATEGVPGVTVTGQERRQRKGREVPLPRSTNAVADEHKTTLHAACDGMVELVGGVVQVSGVYTVKGDVNMGIGNIDFNGSVVVNGSVMAGMTVQATGDLTVGGGAEGCTLEAGGNIKIARGMQGMDRGVIRAGGSVTAQFVERASVSAGEDIKVDMLVHSTAEAGRNLLAAGKRGSIVGGLARADKLVVARTVGTEAAIRTEVEVGLQPVRRKRILFLEKEQAGLAAEYEKLATLHGYLEKADPADEAKRALRASVVGSLRKNRAAHQRQQQELEALRQELECAGACKLHVLGKIHPESHIGIGPASLRIDQPVSFATFTCRDGKIVFGACEYTRD